MKHHPILVRLAKSASRYVEALSVQDLGQSWPGSVADAVFGCYKKACGSCRVSKVKCDGLRPCSR
ncbi:hypothetical protein N658DRAFT_340717 [Parathielavia hyrcaniae]|uniref:Zn(2)-C6 fungal-type domain-containing protein n=1 Tax=Parathielavia hyrcaniae TaxID=113614 RepID=A0AAN6T360_9PEZI|nr:hypothetical protein N658DRAFT_340717 [Parathielavia hyrcaniae]